MNKIEDMLAELDQLSRTFNLFISKKENLTMIPLELISVKYIGSYGNYPDPGLGEQEEGEIVIGKLIPFERNILLISRIMSINIDLIFKTDQLKFQDCDERDILTSIEIRKSNSFRELLTTIYNLSRNILAKSICSRLIQDGITLNQPLTIRNNLNIVKKNVPKEDPSGPKIIILASSVAPEDPDSEEKSIFSSPYPIQ